MSIITINYPCYQPFWNEKNKLPGSQGPRWSLGGSWSIWKPQPRLQERQAGRFRSCWNQTRGIDPQNDGVYPVNHWILGVFQFGTNLDTQIWMSKNHWGDAHELREGVLMPCDTCDLKLRDCEFKWPGKELISTSEILWTWMSKPERAKHNRSSWC